MFFNDPFTHFTFRLFCVVSFSLVATISIIFSDQIFESVDYARDYMFKKSQQKNTENTVSKVLDSKLDLCPITPRFSIGEFVPNRNEISINEFEKNFKRLIHLSSFKNTFELGGYHKPADCIARDRVAILVPVRNRDYQIPILLKNLHPMLMRQQIEYQIFFIYQMPGYWFNRGALFNVGFLEALKIRKWDCFIFHDVDTIPVDDRNLYVCPRANPRHMAGAVDKFNFTYVSDLQAIF